MIKIETFGFAERAKLLGEARLSHRPHPRPDADQGAVASVRKWLERSEVSP